MLDETATTPVTDATVTAWWLPVPGAGDDATQMLEMGQTTTDEEGNYAIKAAPTPEMRRAAAANGGWVNFYVSGYSPSTGMATTMLVSRQVVGGSFVTPPPLKRSETLDSPVLKQRPAPRTARAAERLASLEDEDPTVPASVAPEANLALTVKTANGPGNPGFARRVAYCKWSYGANTQSRQSVVEFHTASNATGRWVYGQSADSDIEGGIKYVGQAWSINGSSHVSNDRSTTVGISYGGAANNYGRSDLLVRHGTITTLDGSTTPAGAPCNGWPSDLTVGTKVSTAFEWVGGAVDNYTLAGAEFIGCKSSPQSLHRTAYSAGASFDRVDGNAAKIGAAGDLGPLWVGAKSGFSTHMEIHYNNITGSGIWLCGTNYFPTTAGVIHAENR